MVADCLFFFFNFLRKGLGCVLLAAVFLMRRHNGKPHPFLYYNLKKKIIPFHGKLLG